MDFLEMLQTDITVGPIHLPFTVLEFLLTFLLPWVAIVGTLRLVFFLLQRMVRKSEWKDETKQTVTRWVRLVRRLIAVVVTLLLASRLLGAELARWSATIFRILNQPFFVSGSTEISVVTLILVIPVFYAASWMGRAARSMFETSILRRLNIDAARQFSMLSIFHYGVMTIAVIVGLSVIGINLSSLTVLFGVLGIGVGFGLQGVVANMFAGLIIIFTRPVKEGDRILVDDIEGNVQEIKFIHTIVNTITDETIIIPNSQITETKVHNYSYGHPSIVVCNTVQVSYGSDLEKVRDVLLEVAKRNPYAVPAATHRFHVWSFDDSGITVRICVVTRNAVERIPAFSWMNMEIWRAFRDNGIEIPFPQRVLHVSPDSAGAFGGAAPSAVSGTDEEGPPSTR